MFVVHFMVYRSAVKHLGAIPQTNSLKVFIKFFLF